MKTVQVKVSDFRENLQVWLARVNDGESLALSEHGKIIARVIPEFSETGRENQARGRLSIIASQCQIGDVISPLWESWDAQPDYG
ncbi:hypothetical protein [Endozoicomonas sp. 4G]|uniref:type II toxin-antitoxin system Phd/YefM family antitoxin n=1 Tax=Endozoicomonas sp. 4G TaxID=2872754 RepID=UPI002078BB1D|nr:hypothetical protein [Endozoicomonas sp. 4G]